MLKSGIAAFLIVTPAAVFSESRESRTTALELGMILAVEEYCGLKYNQAAISNWIDENTDPSDMGFVGSLSSMTEGAKYELEDQSESTKTAQCRSAERTARHYGFIE